MQGKGMEKRFLGRKPYEIGMVVIFFCVWGFIFLDRISIGFVANAIIAELGIDMVQFGLFASVTTLCFAISSIVVGAWSDKSGFRKKWLVPLVLLTGLATMLGTIAPNYTVLMISRAGVGLFAGPCFALMLAMMAHESSPGKMGGNAGLINTGVSVVALTIGPSMIALISSVASWRIAFLVSGLLTILVGIIMIFAIKEVKIEKAAAAPGQKESALRKFGQIAKYKNVVLCFFIGMATMGGYWTFLTYGPLFWGSVGGFDEATVGLIFTIMGFIAIPYAFLIPKISDNIGRRTTMAIFYFLACLVPLFMLIMPDSMVSLVIFCVCAGIPGCMTPLFMAIVPSETLPESLSGTAQGLILGFAEIVGGFAWMILVGFLADSMNLTTAVMLGSGILIIAFVLSLALTETNTKEKRLAAKGLK